MDWETKLAALNALSECSLHMRASQDWYVSQRVDIKDKGILKSVCGNGPTPAKAIEDHWRQVTIELEPHEYLICREYFNGELSRRVACRWNGFMWDHVTEEKPKEAA